LIKGKKGETIDSLKEQLLQPPDAEVRAKPAHSRIGEKSYRVGNGKTREKCWLSKDEEKKKKEINYGTIGEEHAK